MYFQIVPYVKYAHNATWWSRHAHRFFPTHISVEIYPGCIIKKLYFHFRSVHASTSIFPFCVHSKFLLSQENSTSFMEHTIYCEFLGCQVDIVGFFHSRQTNRVFPSQQYSVGDSTFNIKSLFTCIYMTNMVTISDAWLIPQGIRRRVVRTCVPGWCLQDTGLCPGKLPRSLPTHSHQPQMGEQAGIEAGSNQLAIYQREGVTLLTVADNTHTHTHILVLT